MKTILSWTIALLVFFIISCNDSKHEEKPTPLSETNNDLPLGTAPQSTTDTDFLPPSLPVFTDSQQRTQSVQWSLVSAPISEITLISDFVEKYPDIQAIWHWNSTDNHWSVFPPIEGFNILQTLSPNEGYWLKSPASVELESSGSVSNHYLLAKGWNLVGYSHTAEAIPISEFLAQENFANSNCGKGIDYMNVWAWQNNQWKLHLPEGKDLEAWNASHNTQFQTFSILEPGMGIWVNTNGAVFPPTIGAPIRDSDTFSVRVAIDSIQTGLGTMTIEGASLALELTQEGQQITAYGCIGSNSTVIFPEQTSDINITVRGKGSFSDNDQLVGEIYIGGKLSTFSGMLISEEPITPFNYYDGQYVFSLTPAGQQKQTKASLVIEEARVSATLVLTDNEKIYAEGNISHDGSFYLQETNNVSQFHAQGIISNEDFAIQGIYRASQLHGTFASPNSSKFKNSQEGTSLIVSQTTDIRPVFIDDGQLFHNLPQLDHSIEDQEILFTMNNEEPPLDELPKSYMNHQMTKESDEEPVAPTLEKAPDGGYVKPEIDIEEFDNGFNGWQYTPQTIGFESRSGWKWVKHDREFAVRNEPTESPEAYTWTLEKSFDLTNAKHTHLDIKYQYMGLLYDSFSIRLLQNESDPVDLFNTTTPEEGITQQTLDLSKFTGQSVTIQLVLKKTQNVVERRIGLYVHRIGLVYPRDLETISHLTQTPANAQMEFERSTQRRIYSSTPIIQYPAPGSVLPSRKVPFLWTTGSGIRQAQEMHLMLYNARRIIARHQVIENGKAIFDRHTKFEIPTNEGTIRARLKYTTNSGRTYYRYYYYYPPTPKIFFPKNRSTLLSGSVEFIWDRSYAQRVYLMVDTERSRVFRGYVSGKSKKLQVPTNQGIIRARLWYYSNYRWRSQTYEYYPPEPTIQHQSSWVLWENGQKTLNFDRGSAKHIYTQVYHNSRYVTGQFQYGNSMVLNQPSNGETVKIRFWYSLPSPSYGRWYYKEYSYESFPESTPPPSIDPSANFGSSNETRMSIPTTWKLISFPINELVGAKGYLDANKQRLGKDFRVWGWDEETNHWQVDSGTFADDYDNIDDLEVLLPNKGYWIRGDLDLSFQSPGGFQVQTTRLNTAYQAGWNLKGNNLPRSITPSEIISTPQARRSIQSIWKWNSSTEKWQLWHQVLDVLSETEYDLLESISPGEGYWVQYATTTLEAGQFATFNEINHSSRTIFDSFDGMQLTPEERKQKTVEALLQKPNVIDAGVSSEGQSVWFITSSGLTGVLLLSLEEATGIAPSLGTKQASPLKSDVDSEEENIEELDFGLEEMEVFERAPRRVSYTPGKSRPWTRRALVVDPSASEFETTSKYKAMLDSELYRLYNLESIVDNDADLEVYKNLTKHSFLSLVNHGTTISGKVYLETGEASKPESQSQLANELQTGEIIMTADDKYMIGSAFFERYNKNFRNTHIFISSCDALHVDEFAQTLLSLGAKSVAGFDDLISDGYAIHIGVAYFRNIMEGQKIGNAYSAAISSAGSADPKNGGKFQVMAKENNQFVRNQNIQKRVDTIYNQDFELGRLGWRGNEIPGNGYSFFGPKQGSTALGVNTSTGTSYQNFCIPSSISAPVVKFDYGYLTRGDISKYTFKVLWVTSPDSKDDLIVMEQTPTSTDDTWNPVSYVVPPNWLQSPWYSKSYRLPQGSCGSLQFIINHDDRERDALFLIDDIQIRG